MAKALFKGKVIIIGVSGSIAAYKAAEIVSYLAQREARVSVVMTQAATHLVRPLTFQTLAHNRVYTDLPDGFGQAGLWDLQADFNPEHISLAEKADLILIAPATANIIGKIAHGIADDLLTTVVMATRAPIILAPAMNEKMYLNPIVQENIAYLKKHGYHCIIPGKGYLA